MSKHALKNLPTLRNHYRRRRCGYYGCIQWFTVYVCLLTAIAVVLGSYVTGRAFSVAASPAVPKNSVQTHPGGSLAGAANWAWAWLGFRVGWFALCFALVACGGATYSQADSGPTDEAQAPADAADAGFWPCTPPDPIHHPITPPCDAGLD